MNRSEGKPFRPYLQRGEDVLQRLQVVKSEGVSRQRVTQRREKYGANVIPGAYKLRLIKLFFDRFKDVLVIILLSAAGISLAIGHIEDAIIISIAIAIDLLLSFAQVWRTEKTLARMREHVQDTITVRRDGKSFSIPSSELVVGDVIELRAGEKVPADARVLEAQGLRTQEAVLTGESSDVEKHVKRLETKTSVNNQINMLFAGTTVVSGNGLAIVTSVGAQTEFGKIAQMLREQSSPDSPLRRKLQKKGLQIGWIIIGMVGLITGIGLLRGNDAVNTGRTAITLVVSAIPEDLTMILTIALTVGVARILKEGGVIRKLSSGETLGAATVICTDKTGTLTEGKMKASAFYFMQGDTLLNDGTVSDPLHKYALIGLALSNDAHKSGADGTEYVGSATERTALAFVERHGLSQAELKSQWKQRDSLSFDSAWKYRATLVDHPTQSTQALFVTGAPDVLLERSSQRLNETNEPEALSDTKRHHLQKKIDQLASEGKRLLAVGVRRHISAQEITHDDIHDLLFLGVLAIQDPVRLDIQESIAETLSAGVSIKLVTGDHAGTAKAVAAQVGLPSNEDMACTGDELQHMSDDELFRKMKTLTIFSRVEPLDKQRIIRLLQKHGHVVAMTGDGVNDAVALKSADIGVAMGDGTDIAKDAADLVLLNNSFETIVAAIKEGRVLRDNIRKVIAFLLSTNAAEVSIFLVSVIFGWPLPLLPAQVLWINLVTDGTSDIALSLEPAEKDVMHRKPEDPNAPLFGKNLLLHMLYAGIIMTIGSVGMFWYEHLYAGTDLIYARTMTFTFLAVSSLLSVWSFRSLKHTMYERGFWQNKWVPLSAGFSLGIHLLSLYIPGFQSFFGTTPLHLNDWLLILGLAIITVMIMDARKLLIKPKKPYIQESWQQGIIPSAAAEKENG